MAKLLKLVAVVVGWDTFIVLARALPAYQGTAPAAVAGLLLGIIIWKFAQLISK